MSCSDRSDRPDTSSDDYSGSDDGREPSCEEDIEYCVGCDLYDVVKLGDGGLAKREPSCSQLRQDEYECLCDAETLVTVDRVTSCDQALNVACELTDADRQTCRIGEGLCEAEPASEGAWNCVCEDGSWGALADAASCEEAGFSACAVECHSAAGTCAPAAGQRWACDCELYGARTVAAGFDGCVGVLANACEPGHGLSGWGSCTGKRGYCEQPDPAVPLWQCTCLNGRQESVQLGAEAGDEADCGAALRLGCGEESEADRCERSSSIGSVSCVRSAEASLGDAATTLEYACVCSRACRGSVEDFTASVTGDSCVDAMDELCGENGPICDE